MTDCLSSVNGKRKARFRRDPLTPRAPWIGFRSAPVASLAALAVSLTVAPALAQIEAQYEWACEGGANGWSCRQVPTAGTRAQRPASDSDQNDNSLGWVPLDQLSPAQRELVPANCCGAYLPPAHVAASPAPGQSPEENAGQEQESEPPSGAERLEYDRMEGNLQSSYELSGNVRMSQGGRRITADRASVDEENNTATVSGDIRIYEPGVFIVGEQAELNRETGASRIEQGEFVLYESRTRGSAALLARSEDEVITLEDGLFTQCEPGNESWALRGSSIEVDPKSRRGVARNARVELAGIPVFYWPYLPFPVGSERQSGFLFPTITSDDVAVPYYLNLAPNFDMTVTPRYVADRGTMVEAEFRHLSPWFETVLGGAWLGSGDDDISDNEEDAISRGLMTEAEAMEFADQDRWLASIQQEGGRGYRWYSDIDYTKVSDYAYFSHLDTTNLDVNRATHLRQQGELGYRFPNWNVNARFVEYQTIALDVAEPYQQLPKFNANGSYRWGDLDLALNNQFTRFDHAEDYLDPEAPSPAQRRITGDRTRLDYRLAWEKEWLWGFFRPAALLKSINYRLDDAALRPDAETDPSITTPQGVLDMGLFFERDGNWFGNSYLQTFEPRVFYFYSDYESHEDLIGVTPDGRSVDFDTSELTFSYSQLFRTTRFAGGDRIDDDNRVSVGLTTRFLGSSGRERLSVSLGQIFYQGDRRVSLHGEPLLDSRSEMAGQFSAQLTDSLRFGSDVLYDQEENKVNRGNASFRYMDEDHRIFNLGYRYDRKAPRTIDGRQVDQDRSQGDASIVWPLSDSWSFIGRQYYDFTNDRELDSIAGLEYTSCCYRLRVAWRRWLDNDLINRINDPTLDLEYDQGIFFELQLRGLGGVGSSNIRNALAEGIYNFNRREEAILGRPID
ncbi:LPS-assembly protein LptD [Gilvimarinus sp. F26214L]|uniref:LPS-assembly protein LptD n=1 Tax=Gilvimarinus sp. DZF01 TaxID=3461371 RepID=UPI0040452F30